MVLSPWVLAVGGVPLVHVDKCNSFCGGFSLIVAIDLADSIAWGYSAGARRGFAYSASSNDSPLYGETIAKTSPLGLE